MNIVLIECNLINKRRFCLSR